MASNSTSSTASGACPTPIFEAEPPYLAIGTEVSAKYKGAFCEARIQKVQRLVKCRVTFKNNLGASVVTDENIRGPLRVGSQIEARHPDKNVFVEATISKIIDASLYTVVFDDGDITTLRRNSLCLKSGKHFSESESLDHLPLTNPEHFGNPVSLGVRGGRKRRRRSIYGHTLSSTRDSSANVSDTEDNESFDGLSAVGSLDDEDSNTNLSKTKDDDEFRDPDTGKVICVDYGDKRNTKLKDGWFPALIVSPSAQENSAKFDVKEEHLVKSFINGRFYQLSRKETKQFTKEMANSAISDSNTSAALKSSLEKALAYLERDELPSNWDYEILLGTVTSPEAEDGALSSDLESFLDEEDADDKGKTSEEKDRFVAQLYKFMDERDTPINKTPNVGGKDLDLYNLYRLVNKLGGYNRVTAKSGWKDIYNKLNLPTSADSSSNESSYAQLKIAYKEYLLNFVDFYRKLGCTMVSNCLFSRTSARTARSERNWRSTSESSKDVQASKSNTRRKPKLLDIERVKEEPSKEDADAKQLLSEKTPTSPEEDDKISTQKKSVSCKKPRKSSTRKKYKLIDADDSNINGNEPEEKYIPGDSDSESDNDQACKSALGKEVTIGIGDRIRVKYGKGKQLKVYEAKVLKITGENEELAKQRYFVHYTGWNIRYDEWIKRNRIVELVRDKSPKRRGGAKTKNKGVPLEDNKDTSVVKESALGPVVSKEVKDTFTSKRGRPSSLSTVSSKSPEKSLREERVRKETEKKLVSAISKRSRQRSECLETTDNEENASETGEELPEVKRFSKRNEQENSDDIKKFDRSEKAKEKEVSNLYDETEKELSEKSSFEESNFSGSEQPTEKCIRVDMMENHSIDIKYTPTQLEMKEESIEALIEEKITEPEQEEHFLSAEENEFSEEQSNSVERNEPNNLQIITTESVEENLYKEVQNGAELASKTEERDEIDNLSDCSRATAKSEEVKTLRSEEELVRKRKTRKNRTSEEFVSSKKLKKNHTISIEEDVQMEINSGPFEQSGSKRRRLNSRTLSESESEEIKEIKTKTVEPIKNSTITGDTVEQTETSEELATASFLLCKEEEIPASPVCDVDEEQSRVQAKSDLSTLACASSPPERNSSSKERSTKLSCISSFSLQANDKENYSLGSLSCLETQENSCVQFPESEVQSPLSSASQVTPTQASPASSHFVAESLEQAEIGGENHTLNDERAAENLINFSQEEQLRTELEICSNTPRKKRRGRVRTGSNSEANSQTNQNHSNYAAKELRVSGCKTRGALGRRLKSSTNGEPHGDFGFESNEPNSPAFSCNAKGQIDYQPISKYNFCLPLDENLDSDRRILILQERLAEVRKTYMSIKSEVASIDRRRKKLKRKERASPSSPSSSSLHSDQRSAKDAPSGDKCEDSREPDECQDMEVSNDLKQKNSLSQMPVLSSNEMLNEQYS